MIGSANNGLGMSYLAGAMVGMYGGNELTSAPKGKSVDELLRDEFHSILPANYGVPCFNRQKSHSFSKISARNKRQRKTARASRKRNR